MKCEICGKEYKYSCPHCTRRVKTWGVDGLMHLMEFAKRESDIDAQELVEIVNTYYVGKATISSDKVNVLKRALRELGYKGKYIGRIHINKTSYLSKRRREHETGRRWGLRNSTCYKCGSTENLRLHHIVPLSWGGLSTPANCITLCETCHRVIHRNLANILTREKLLEYLSPHYEEIEELARQSIMGRTE